MITMQINFFKNVKNLEDLKNQYRKLAKKYHPDINPEGSEAMKKINLEFEFLFEQLKTKKTQTETAQEFRDIISKIINLNINIEIIGNWIWITGKTYPVKVKLKAAGFKWSKNKKAWYWHPAGYKKFSKKKFSLDEIRDLYGSQKVKEQEETQALPA